MDDKRGIDFEDQLPKVVADEAPEDLKRRAAMAVARRLAGEWTFQKPVAGRPPIEDADPRVRARREEGRKFASDGKLPPAERPAAAGSVPTRSRQTYQNPAALGEQYKDEQTATGDWRPAGMGEARTPYYEGDEQEKRRLSVSEGKLKRGNEAFDTTKSKGGHFGSNVAGREIFAMGKDGKVYATDPVAAKDAGVTVDPHHSSLVHGEEVIGAGEIAAKDGVVHTITDRSGHYKPTPAQMADVVNELEAQGVPMIDPDPASRKRAKVQIGSGSSERVMDFERYSQTGGNLEQIDRKKNTLSEIAHMNKAGEGLEDAKTSQMVAGLKKTKATQRAAREAHEAKLAAEKEQAEKLQAELEAKEKAIAEEREKVAEKESWEEKTAIWEKQRQEREEAKEKLEAARKKVDDTARGYVSE